MDTSPTDSIAITCRAVTKIYGKGDNAVTALRGVDLDVRFGELLMLIGPSGCGKTTLISVMAGILDQTDGECLVLGQDLKALGVRRKTRFRGRNIGFVFQQFNLLPALTTTENVAVPLILNGAGRGEATRKAKAVLERVGLAEKLNVLPSQLSGGQQQRVAIARALVHEPKIIVCDEPTSALDHKTGQTVIQLMRDVSVGADRSLIIVTHDARIFSYADRIARMDDGRVVQIAHSIEELESETQMAAAH
jgi:putative ABC transport system ATP-binding protein